MYRTPSSRRKKKKDEKLNLIPILDSIFIFIFFLLLSASFMKMYEIQSDVPIISDQEPPPSKEPPLALTITVEQNSLIVSTGVPSKVIKTIKNISEKEYDLTTLHSLLVDLKRSHLNEDTAILEPKHDIDYEALVKIMDAIRLFQETDEALYKKDKSGINVRLEQLFGNLVFSNIMS